MAHTRVVQSSFLSGVLDPRAGARIDSDAYNQGMLRGINVTPGHLGGIRRRAGTRFIATLPGTLTRRTAGVTITAPNGGTTANANDGNTATVLLTTANVGTTDPYVVVHYDLGATFTIVAADAVRIKTTGGSSLEFRIQYSNDDTFWTDMGSAFAVVNTVARDYRRVDAIPARYWRVVKVGGTDLGAEKVSIAEFSLYEDSGNVSNVRLIPFEISTDDRYVVAVTDLTGTIFKDGVYVLSVPMPYLSADIMEIDAANSAETLVIVHEDYAPRFLLRESLTNFQCDPITFEHIPQNDFNDSSSPTPVSDVQVITFNASWVQGDTFQVELEGARTGSITFAGDATANERAATAANIAREVQKLFSVHGFTGVSCARTGALAYTVTLADASARAYELMSVTPLSAVSTSAAATVSHTTTGSPRSEDAWSATRGYPRTATFFENRLYFGGTKSLQQSLFGSAVNNILDFRILEGLADDPIFTTLSGQQLNAINGVFAGRSLQAFTTGGEFRYAKPQGTPIEPGDAPANQTQYGSARIRPVTIDGATIYIQRNRKSVRDFRFNYEEDAYDSLGVSALAAHLIYDVQDLTAWNGSRSDEIGLVFAVNGVNPNTGDDDFADGTVAVFNSRKESQIQAWTIWTTDGFFKAVASVLEDSYFAVLRDIDGVDTLFLEQSDQSLYTDCAVQKTQASSATITGLDHLEGEEVRIRVDGFVLQSRTVAGGQVNTELAGVEVEVGLNFNPDVTPMPLNSMTPAGGAGTGGPNFMRKRRVVKVHVKTRNTLGLLVDGQELPDRQYDVDSFDTPLVPFSGNSAIEATSNWDMADEKIISFTQVDPLPMEILGIDVYLEVNE
jgi:hypothetical protein